MMQGGEHVAELLETLKRLSSCLASSTATFSAAVSVEYCAFAFANVVFKPPKDRNKSRNIVATFDIFRSQNS